MKDKRGRELTPNHVAKLIIRSIGFNKSDAAEHELAANYTATDDEAKQMIHNYQRHSRRVYNFLDLESVDAIPEPFKL